MRSLSHLGLIQQSEQSNVLALKAQKAQHSHMIPRCFPHRSHIQRLKCLAERRHFTMKAQHCRFLPFFAVSNLCPACVPPVSIGYSFSQRSGAIIAQMPTFRWSSTFFSTQFPLCFQLVSSLGQGINVTVLSNRGGYLTKKAGSFPRAFACKIRYAAFKFSSFSSGRQTAFSRFSAMKCYSTHQIALKGGTKA